MPESPDRCRIPFPFPLVPVAELRRGDLLHLGGSAYALVADVQPIDDVWAEVSIFDGDRARPEAEPRQWTDTVPIAHRGIAAPLTPDQARRRDSALAAMDRVRAAIGAVTGVDEEIDRIRGRDPAAVPPGPLDARPVPGLLDVLACHRGDGPLLLDVGQPDARAILALFAELKDGEGPDGGWNGADTVDAVTRWLERLGIDPSCDLDWLRTRCARDVSTARLARVVAAWQVGEVVSEPLDDVNDVDLDRVARLVRAAGIECVVDTPGDGIAVLVAGPPQAGPRWASPWAAHAGPGRYGWDRPSTASTARLMVGPDDGGQVRPTSAARVGAVTEERIAALIVAQACIADPSSPLTPDELVAIGLDSCGTADPPPRGAGSRRRAGTPR